MQFKTLAVAAAAAGLAVAQRPTNTSICDYYTTALLKNNTAANQKMLLTLVVNTAVIGNYSPVTVGSGVPGILKAGMYNGTEVNLLPYFSGALLSTNNGGKAASVNFLDDGGAVPLTMNKPANGTSSAQYTLLTHLYEYFGVLLGCSMQGSSDYPAYAGDASMYQVHKFMDLSAAEVGYFISQVAASAASFGVATSDLTIVGNALTSTFDVRCAPASTVVMAQGPQLNSICVDSTCALAPNSTCSAYNDTLVEPANVTSTSTGSGTPTSTSSGSHTGTGSATPSSSGTSGATTIAMSFGAIAAGVFAAFL